MEVQQPAGSRPPIGAAVAVAIAVFAVVTLATYFFATSDSATDVEVAGPDEPAAQPIDEPDPEPADTGSSEPDNAQTSDDQTGSDSAEPPPPIDTDQDIARPASDGFGDEASAEFGHGGESTIVHSSDGFGSLRWSETGFVARRSPDGLSWTDTPTTGLPDEAQIRILTRSGGQFVVVLEQYVRFDEGAEPFFFEELDAPTYLLATSPDLVGWAVATLPAIEPTVEGEYGTSVFMVGVDANDSGIAALYNIVPRPPNEMQLLFEAEIVTEDDFGSYCGLSWESFDANEPVSVYTCDFEAEEALWADLEERLAAADSDEEAEAIEREFELVEPARTEIGSIEPGTELYEALRLANHGEGEPDITTVALAGPVGGPYTTTELDTTGYPNAVVATDTGFVALIGRFAENVESGTWEASSSVLLSTDAGATWSEPALIVDAGLYEIAASGQLVVATGGDDQGNPLIYVSTDAGATWSPIELGAGLYNAWATPRSGPAGLAIWVEGATEPYPEFPPFQITAEKDGYLLELMFEEDLVRLTGPDGTIIHELDGLGDLLDAPDVPGVVREEEDDSATFLDPETGEDLVTFTEEDLERAFVESERGADNEYVEPPRVREISFSADGIDWRALDLPISVGDNAYMQVAAVGDDEVLVSITTWIEPPAALFAFEAENREPTDDEIEAIDSWFAANDGGSEIEWYRLPVG